MEFPSAFASQKRTAPIIVTDYRLKGRRKQGGNEQVAPKKAARQDLQEQEEEYCVGAVEGHIDHVRTAGVQTKDLAIQHMREPG